MISNGRIRTVIDGNGNRAELRYDGHGRQDRWTFPSATRPAGYNDATQATALATAGSVNAADYEAYGYDAAGNRTQLAQARRLDADLSIRRAQPDDPQDVPERAGLDPIAHAATSSTATIFATGRLFARFDSARRRGRDQRL